MPVRTDLDYFWPISPRIVQVQTGGAFPTELSVEDIVDSFRTKEADADLEAMDDDFLLDATGRDDLGGGVEVGITATGNNVQVAFKARTTPISTMTEDTGDTDGVLVRDVGGTLETDGAKRGDIVINFTDQSMASILSVDGEGQATTDGLTGGTDNQFDIGDVCKVYPVVQCELSGGNWVANDAIGDPMSPVFPTFGTQIVRSSASSATTQQQADIEYGSFDGGVTIDIIGGVPGTTGDIGKPRNPVNNVLDALTISGDRGLPMQFFIIGDITFTTGHDLTGYKVGGQSMLKSLIAVDAGAVVVDVEFSQCTLQGTLDVNTSAHSCIIKDLAYAEGFFVDCALDGTIILGGSAETHFVNCHDATAGGGAAITTIDMGGSGRGLLVRNFEGGLKIINKTGAEEVSIGVHLGRVLLDSTITNGELLVRVDTGKITDDSGPGATVTSTVMNPTTIEQNILKLIESQRGHHTATGNVFYWDPINGLDTNNGLTPLTAKLTWGGASGLNSLVVAQNHDVVLGLPGEIGGTTVITEQVVFDKEYTLIRAVGRDMVFRPIATTGATVSIKAEGVELSGVRIETALMGDGEALEVSADFCYLHDVWVEFSRGDGIRLQNVSYAKLSDIHIRNCLGNGLVFNGATQDCMYNSVSNLESLLNGGHGVLFTGANCVNNYVWGDGKGTAISRNTGWGVKEESGADFNHILGPSVHIDDNTAGEIDLIGAGSAAENIGAIDKNVWEYVVENGKKAVEFLRILKAAAAGKLSGASTTNIKIRDDADSKDRIDATVTSDGDRTDVTTDGS